MSKTLIKIAADGTEMPADAKGHVAVLIPELKLMFPAHDIYDGTLRWKEIQKPCEDLQLAGFNDWRPVTIEEGFLFCDRTRYSPAIDTTAFPDTESDWYWSNTPTAWAPSCVFVVGFSNGGVYYGYDRNAKAFVRAVSRAPAGQ